MITELKDEIQRWVEHSHAISIYNILNSLCNCIDQLEERVKSLESAPIVRDAEEPAAKQADSSDSFAENRFCAKKQNSEHIQPISENKSQKKPEYGINPSSSLTKCCGNCDRFVNEDASGIGNCLLEACAMTSCSDLCPDWKHKPFHEGEAVMWKTYDNKPETWKLGFYCSGNPMCHVVRNFSDGGTVHNVKLVRHFDTFDPYKA